MRPFRPVGGGLQRCALARRRSRPARAAAAAAGEAVADPFSLAAADPFSLVAPDLAAIERRIAMVYGSGNNDVVRSAADVLRPDEGVPRLRPCVVLLCGYAALPGEPGPMQERFGAPSADELRTAAKELSPAPFTFEGHVMDPNPQAVRPSDRPFAGPFGEHLVLAELTELMHAALSVHDRVPAAAAGAWPSPRSSQPVGSAEKVALLAGDYLLSRASQSLATLHPDIVAVMSGGFEDASTGEVMLEHGAASDSWEQYSAAAWAKTASLFAAACHSAAALSDPGAPRLHDALYRYGRHLGLAYHFARDLERWAGAQGGTPPPPRLLGTPVGRAAAQGAAVFNANAARAELEELPQSQARAGLDRLCNLVTLPRLGA